MTGLKQSVCGVALAFSVTSAAQAQTIDMSKFTCGQLLTGAADSLDAAVWISGYYNGLRKNTKLNLGSFKANAAAVIDECKGGDPKKTVMQTIDTMLSRKK